MLARGHGCCGRSSADEEEEREPIPQHEPTISPISGSTDHDQKRTAHVSRTAMITPPTAVIGASTSMVSAICRKNSGFCWTSVGVARDVGKRSEEVHLARREPLRRAEDLRKRRSRTDALDAKDAVVHAHYRDGAQHERDARASRRPCARCTAGLPLTDPVVMMSAFRLGRTGPLSPG